MTNPNVPQDPSAPKFDLIRREIAEAIRREWGRLGEQADELSATAEAVSITIDGGGKTTRHSARLRAAALTAAATRASVVLGDVQRIAGRIEGLAVAATELEPDEPESPDGSTALAE
jgi:hypothetical protein